MTDALFIDPGGHYPALLGTEHCWDAEKDARAYNGEGPVVCHPPCGLWVNLAAVNWKRYGRQRPAWYPGGDDGGCFAAALANLWRTGGVLEHPAFSHAWDHYGLRKPYGIGWCYQPDVSCAVGRGGYHVCEVWQSAYGHRARKRTWLLYCGGITPYDLNWSRIPGTHQVGWFDRNKQTLSKREALATPLPFALELLKLARHSRT